MYSDGSNSEGVRDLYQEMMDGKPMDAWEFCEKNFDKEVLGGLTGYTEDGEKCSEQNIESMLNMVEDLGKYTMAEWVKFFETVRVEGI